jgi:4-hydroxy-tetrahydrodipicolinate synthase
VYQNFHGVFTALITPFKEGEVDYATLSNLIEYQIKHDVNGLVPCGSTGEVATLTEEEYKEVIKLTVEVSNKRSLVMAGVSSNCTTKAIKQAEFAEYAGADAIMVVAPYYNKPTQEGIYQHFHAISMATSLPIFIYNIPGRCVVDISNDTILRLAELNNIIGLKDASGNIERPARLAYALRKPFSQLCGDDGMALAFNIQGGHGCISVLSNIFPQLSVRLYNLWHEGKVKEAMALNHSLVPIYSALFCETNPIPIKYAASLLGLSKPEVRLPLTMASLASQHLLKDIIKQYQSHV